MLFVKESTDQASADPMAGCSKIESIPENNSKVTASIIQMVVPKT
jgi:hypothetical protein